MTAEPGTRPRSKSTSKGRRASKDWRGLDELTKIEMTSAVLGQFAKRCPIGEIGEAVNAQFPKAKMTRQGPWPLLREALQRGWIRFDPPAHARWEIMLKNEYPWLQTARVVQTATAHGVAQAGAESLLNLLKAYRQDDRRVVHIGFSGGHAMRALVRAFSRRLGESTDPLPGQLVIHAMAAGFSPREPTTDPNTFCSYFATGCLNDIEVEFVGFSAPSLLKSVGIPSVREMPDIQAAFAAVPDIDIIVTSGSSWLDEHSALRNLMDGFPESMRILEEEGCVADVFWRPLSERGPIERETDVRALTLVELSQLPQLIRQGKHVLLTLGPCGKCDTPKGALLECLLGQPRPLMSDLVVDTRTVAQMLRLQAEGKPNGKGDGH